MNNDRFLIVKNIKSFIIFEPRNITVHYESAKNKEELKEWIKYIKDNNCKVGISIKPETKVEEIYDLLPYIHTVLIMTVEPGKGGQELIKDTIKKVEVLNEYSKLNDLEIDIEVDGGINDKTAPLVKSAGANILVSGNYITGSNNFKESIENLKK